MTEAKNLGAPYELVREVRELGRLPVVLFCAGGVATPADAALVMRLGCGWRLRRLRHLQVGGPAAHGEGHRQGDDAFRGSRDSGRGLARSG